MKLRRGGRILGGSLSWDKPQQLAGFSRDGPFNGMAVPTDVTVTRQVLAEPDSQLNDRTWATLADGTPLVTAERRGKGLIVLFHVTADSRWSDLPLSGSFVEMLRRLVSLAGATVTADGDSAVAENAGGRAAQAVPPTRVLDGFGAFTTPPPTARPIPSNYTGRGSLDHPPGFYGPPEGLVAVNTLAPADRPAPLDISYAECAPRRLSARRAPRPARADLPHRACTAGPRRIGRGHAVWRLECLAATATRRSGDAGGRPDRVLDTPRRGARAELHRRSKLRPSQRSSRISP